MTWYVWRLWRLACVPKGTPCAAGLRVGDARGMWRPITWRLWWLTVPVLPRKVGA